MARQTGSSSSKTGDGQTRTTFTYKDGSTRDVTEVKGGGTTVTDTDSSGNQKTGKGTINPLGKAGFGRIDKK